MNCKNCGQPLGVGEAFCRSCGAVVQMQTIPGVTETPPVPPVIPVVADKDEMKGFGKPKKKVPLLLILIVLIILVVGVYFVAGDKILSQFNKTTTTTTTTKPNNNYEYAIIINDETICDTKYDCVDRVNKLEVDYDLIDIKIETNINNPDYEITAVVNHKLTEGKNKIVIGKNKTNNEDLYVEIYRFDLGKLITIQDAQTKQFDKIVNGIDCDIVFVANRMIDETEDLGESFQKCNNPNCKSIADFKKFLQNEYKVTERYAQERIDDMLTWGSLKVENNELYFKGIIGGCEEQLFFKGYLKQDGKTYVFYYYALEADEPSSGSILHIFVDGLFDERIRTFPSM